MNRIQISLAAARVNAGLTPKKAAKAMNISKRTLIKWEKGHLEPKVSQSRGLSELYKMPLDNIFLPPKSN